MKKSTKGALAAGGAAVLLMGGAGTLAFWNDTAAVQGTSVEAGHLKLVNPTCTAWKVSNTNATTTDLVAATRLVPGDTISRSCTYTTEAIGNNLKATVAVSSPTLTGNADLRAELSTTNTKATYRGSAVTLGDNPVTVVNGGTLVVDYVVDWGFGVLDNDTNVLAGGVTQTLSDIGVTLTQTQS